MRVSSSKYTGAAEKSCSHPSPEMVPATRVVSERRPPSWSVRVKKMPALSPDRLDAGRAVEAFVQAGLTVRDAHLCEDTLEDYFKRVTGGEGIG